MLINLRVIVRALLLLELISCQEYEAMYVGKEKVDLESRNLGTRRGENTESIV
jgi:hypothetical protein